MSEDESYKTHQKDSRIRCRYGAKCYQKNPVHHGKYKHPSRIQQSNEDSRHEVTTGKKRKLDDKDGKSSSDSSDSRYEIDDPESPERKRSRSLSRSPTENIASVDASSVVSEKEFENKYTGLSLSPSTSDPSKARNESLVRSPKAHRYNESPVRSPKAHSDNESPVDPRESIKVKFLMEMPNDFYKLYELCNKISPKDPCQAFRAANLLLVGPYDVLNGKLNNVCIDDKQKYLQHWRYYYDPPEFQTIIKGDDKEALHFGYWRDDPSEQPAFVAKNSANINCKIIPVAENIFGAIDGHIEKRIKTANPFEKSKLASLYQQVKTFAKQNDITLDKSTKGMRDREVKVVARTFHGAGIVVPYDKKTQLGYRELSEADGDIKKILKRMDECEDDYEREGHLAKLEEVVRLATIAADECDFGTCLELGHDLFSSGSVHIQNTAIQMLTIAYTLLKRPQFLEIAKAHAKGRKKGSDLSIL